MTVGKAAPKETGPYEAELSRELSRLAEAVAFPSAESFVFAGHPLGGRGSRRAAETDTTSGSAGASPSHEPGSPSRELIERLVDALYWNAYVRRFDAASSRSADDVEFLRDENFLAELSAANQSRSRWDAGWTVEHIAADGTVQARKGDCYRGPVPGEYSCDIGPGTRPSRGDQISIQVLHESSRLQPAFYFCFSEVIPDQYDEFQSVRFYFNIAASGAATLLHELSGRLNRFGVPFRFKCPISPSLFDRLDAGVLYVPFRYLVITSRCVAALLPLVEGHLGEDVPLFTKRVRPGIGMAEDPGTLGSFGRHRCELVARGLFAAASAFVGTSDPLEAIRRKFLDECLQFDRPWLNPGSIDRLEISNRSGLPARVREIVTRSVSEDPGPSRPEPRSRFGLGCADRIGSRICRDAVWAGDACNWLDWSGEEQRGEWVAVHRALGPDSLSRCGGISIYGGTSGIALFLSRLFGQTGEPLHRETLRGAAKQISAQLAELDDNSRVGFYTGWPGASWVLTEIGRQLDDDSLVETELSRLEETAAIEPRLPETDLILGSAGLITALVDLHLKYDRTSLLDIAIRHGDFLLSTADRSESGWSWETMPVPAHQNLTGYGHGVSGIVCSLAELFRATGEDRFRAAIDEGLRYESHHFSAEDGNWRDFRADAGEKSEEVFQSGWCHGAPGIGMARLRLMELGFDSAAVQADLEAALRTTVAKLHYADLPGQRDFCICHGLAGNAELPLLASQWPGRESLIEHAGRVAQTGIELFEESGFPWAYNLGGTGETPTLFCGMAGIGHFYLRLAAPQEVPSILLLRPDHKEVV